jgi:uncharacterized protein
MQRQLVEILACPLCKAPLTLAVAREDATEVLEGSLTCTACAEVYPITEGIPNLLPPDLRRAMEQEATRGGGH